MIKKQAVETAQIVMQNYMMERLLERISLSKYKSNFVLKGSLCGKNAQTYADTTSAI